MKRIILTFLFVLLAKMFFAQPKGGAQRGERIEALKVAYITQALKLTAEEAQKFWPIFNSYVAELKKAKMDNKDDELTFQEQALAIKKKYKPEFKKILNDDTRVNTIFKAEGEFRNELKKELQKRMEERRKKQPPQQ